MFARSSSVCESPLTICSFSSNVGGSGFSLTTPSDTAGCSDVIVGFSVAEESNSLVKFSLEAEPFVAYSVARSLAKVCKSVSEAAFTVACSSTVAVCSIGVTPSFTFSIVPCGFSAAWA